MGGNFHPGRWFNSSTHLLKLLDLGLFKHGEHIGIGALCSLLGFLGWLWWERASVKRVWSCELENWVSSHLWWASAAHVWATVISKQWCWRDKRALNPVSQKHPSSGCLPGIVGLGAAPLQTRGGGGASGDGSHTSGSAPVVLAAFVLTHFTKSWVMQKENWLEGQKVRLTKPWGMPGWSDFFRVLNPNCYPPQIFPWFKWQWNLLSRCSVLTLWKQCREGELTFLPTPLVSDFK